MVNQPQLHPVGSFAERHPANSPHGDFSQTFTPTFPQPTENISNSILSGERGRFTDKVSQNANSSVKRQGFPDKRGVESPGQMRTVVFQTDTDRGLTDKRGLRFTDRRSLDFPDTCHLDFPDTRQMNFPDASYLTKRPESGTTELPSQMARGGLTALGTRGRGPRSGRAWSAQSSSETGRGEPTTTTPGRLFC